MPSEAENYFLDRDGSLVFVSTESQKKSPIGKEMKGSALLPWNFAKINYLLLTGRWLQMNEFSGSKTSVKDALITENNTVALGAALFCTMQVASFQGYADLDFELIQENWGQTFADRFKQCSLPLMLSAGVLSVLSVLYCIMMLMVIGELSGDAEVERLAAKRGVAMNGGFLLFFFSLIIIAHTNTHTHKQTHTHTYTYTHKTHIHTHSHAYMYLYIYLFNLCHTHKCTDEYNHVCTHMHAHTHMRTHTYAPQGRI
jgi:hypothetical protein